MIHETIEVSAEPAIADHRERSPRRLVFAWSEVQSHRAHDPFPIDHRTAVDGTRTLRRDGFGIPMCGAASFLSAGAVCAGAQRGESNVCGCLIVANQTLDSALLAAAVQVRVAAQDNTF